MLLTIAAFNACDSDKLRNGEDLSTIEQMGSVADTKALADSDTLVVDTIKSNPDTIVAVPIEKTDTLRFENKEMEGCDTAFSLNEVKEVLKNGYERVDTTRKVDVIIVHSSHYTGKDTFSVKGVISLYRRYGVSAHYLIDREGHVINLVNENDVSFHAGESILPANPSRKRLNSCSIGIEVISTKADAPTEAQYAALEQLIAGIRTRHGIQYIYRHSDVAPGRKDDPWSFDWEGFLGRINWRNPDPIPVKSIDVNEEVDRMIGIAVAQQ